VVGNLITVIATALLVMTRLILQLIILNKSAKHFGERKYIFLLPVFDIFLPLVNLYILTIGRTTSKGKSVRWK